MFIEWNEPLDWEKYFLSPGGCQVLAWYINDSILNPVLRTSQWNRRGQGVNLLHKADIFHGGPDGAESIFGVGWRLGASFRGVRLWIRPWKMVEEKDGRVGWAGEFGLLGPNMPPTSTKDHWIKLEFYSSNKYSSGMVGIGHWDTVMAFRESLPSSDLGLHGWTAKETSDENLVWWRTSIGGS